MNTVLVEMCCMFKNMVRRDNKQPISKEELLSMLVQGVEINCPLDKLVVNEMNLGTDVMLVVQVDGNREILRNNVLNLYTNGIAKQSRLQ